MNSKVDGVISEVKELIVHNKFVEAFDILLPLDIETNPMLAGYLGYLYSQRNFSKYDLRKAMASYEVGAKGGDGYSQESYACLLFKAGGKSEALSWLEAASTNGRSRASFMLYAELRKSGDFLKSLEYLNKASNQGDARATQLLARMMIGGKLGLKNRFVGAYLYIANIPRLVRFAKLNIGQNGEDCGTRL
jgi:TPR repeat protein